MTNKLRYFVGNWKMFGDFSSFKILNRINHFCYATKSSIPRKKIIMCVPNTLMHSFEKNLKSKLINLGAQNCHHSETYGPYTGAVNAEMLKKSGAEYIILGHSESRQMGDTNILIKKKIKSALKHKLKIIFCIGETMQEKKRGKTFFIIKKQIRDSIEKNYNLNKIIIAYEPVWSIGTNKLLETENLIKTIKFIKNELKNIFKIKKPPIVLYGGSVNEKNIKIFSSIYDIDGFLVGRASQSAKKFIDIIKNYYK